MKSIKYSTVFLLAVAWFARADFRGRVVNILDGDTIEILQENNELKRIRLNGIDALEKAQPFGQSSRQVLTAMSAGKLDRVKVEVQNCTSTTS